MHLCDIRTWCRELYCCYHKKAPGLRVSLHQVLQGVIVSEIPGVALLSASRALGLACALLELQVAPNAAGTDCMKASIVLACSADYRRAASTLRGGVQR